MASAPLNKARGVGRGAFAPCVDENAGTISLPCLTLNRGSRTRLPSGEDFARKFEYEPLAPEDVCPPSLDQDDQNFFEQESMRGRTPLWYYLLREAALENKQEPATEDDPEIIQKLGKIGSRIVAETIYQVLSADANSIFNAGSRWEPPFLEAKNGDPFRVTSMLDLIGFVRACDENRASS